MDMFRRLNRLRNGYSLWSGVIKRGDGDEKVY